MARTDAVGGDAGSVGLFRLAIGVLAVLLALIFLIFAAEWVSRPELFPVRAVQFEGEFKHVTRSELAAAVADTAQGNFLMLDLGAVKARAESVPWVYQAEVRRRWPSDLLIRFTEQQPLARWSDYRETGGNATPGAAAVEIAWVNQGMQVVHVRGDNLPSDVPWLEGPAGTQAIVYERFEGFSRLLAPAGLQVHKLTFTPRRTWEIELTNGFTLVLDRVQPEKKLDRFVRAYPRALAHARATIRQVDLRYTNGFSVTWHPPHAGVRSGMKTVTPVGVTNEEG